MACWSGKGAALEEEVEGFCGIPPLFPGPRLEQRDSRDRSIQRLCPGDRCSSSLGSDLQCLLAVKENQPPREARLGDRETAITRILAGRILTNGEENGIVKVVQQKSDTGQRPGRRISTEQRK